ncbi:MAG: hypothetical protein Tsb007_45860 [Rhizobacter sp.]
MTSAISSFVAPVAPQPQPMQGSAPPDNGFARMLSQRQAMAPDTAVTSPPQPAEPAQEPSAAKTNTRRADAPARPAGERQAKADKAKPSANEPSPKTEAAPPGEAVAETDAEAVDPALAEWLTALNLPAAPAETPATTLAQGGERAGLAFNGQPAKAGPRTPGDAPQGVSPRGDATQELTERVQVASDKRAKPEPATAEAQTEASTWQAAVERVTVLAEAPSRQETPALGALGAAAPTPGATRSAEAAAPVAVSMPTPATAPEFAQSLGVQVSVLARDGIQTAELHLNPAEMGPISVQIALDGTQAQVNFGADSATTRQIIESGLPELAAALRDAGFTLSGGGVHSQARGRGEGGEASGGSLSGSHGTPAETEVTPRHVTARVSAGGVDLYA